MHTKTLYLGIRAKPIVVALFATSLLISRRWNQIQKPNIWVEDGTQHIPQYLADGWQSIFAPTQGYVQITGRLITAGSLELFGSHYATGATILTILLFFGLSLLIARQVSYLPALWSMPIIVAALPIDPEPVLLPSYFFWYAGLAGFSLPFIRITKASFLELATLVAFSSTSPFSLLSLPPMAVIAFYKRKSPHKIRYLLLFLVTILALITTTRILPLLHRATNNKPLISSAQLFDLKHSLYPTISSLFKLSTFFSSDHPSVIPSGILFVLIPAFVGIGYIQLFRILRRENCEYFLFIIAYLHVMSFVLPFLRLGLNEFDPVTSGPRYFFYTYSISIYIGLIGIIESCNVFQSEFAQITHVPFSLNRRSCVQLLILLIQLTALAATFILSFERWLRQKRHDNLFPASEIENCAGSKSNQYIVPVAFDGSEEFTWKMKLSKDQCKTLVAKPLARFISWISHDVARFPKPQIPMRKELGSLLKYPKSTNPHISDDVLGAHYWKIISEEIHTNYDGKIIHRGPGFNRGRYLSFLSSNKKCASLLGDLLFILPSTKEFTMLDYSNRIPAKCRGKLKVYFFNDPASK